MTAQSRRATLVAAPRITLNFQGNNLLFNLTEEYHILGREPSEPSPIGLKVPSDWGIVSRCQACLRRVGEDFYIYDGDGKNQPSSNGLFIDKKLITPQEGYLLEHGNKLTIGQNPRQWVIITYIDPLKLETISIPKQHSVSLKNRSVVLGRDEDATLRLEAPIISRHHATIDSNAQGQYVIHDHSTNGVFVNDQKVQGSAIINNGDSIRLGPYTFVLQGDELVLADQGDKIRLDVQNISRIVKFKKKNKVLLNHISLVVEPGQLVALVGGSGAGKSTLLKTLLGIEPSSEGSVYLNGDDLRKYFNIYRTLIGYVPQQDIIHTNLTVKEVLYYAAKLRLPPDINLKEVIDKTLEEIDLVERQDTLVKNLSGGQLKRVSIGVELLADPKLFFLDEPTSGLDPGLDKQMMDLFAKLAHEGRTVVVVTHATNNINVCDRLVFLGLGGYLCYFGPPDKATEFFEIESGDFADIYIKLKSMESVIDESERYKESDYQKEYIDNRLGTASQKSHALPQQVKQPFFQQLFILIQRYLTLIVRDKLNLALSLLTAPIGISLITLAIRQETPFVGSPDPSRAALALKVLFVFTCAAIWVGLASSLQEIVKESAVYLRERLVNLGLFTYLVSKVFTLGGLAFLQSILISLVVLISFKHPDPDFQTLVMPWPLAILFTTFLTLVCSISLGLMVSASVKNTTQANSALPLLLLPQIIFAGVLFKMKGVGKFISWLMVSRWSVGAYGTIVDINMLIPPSGEKTELGSAYKLPIEQSPLYDPTWNNLLLNWGLLLLHTLIYLGVTVWLQKRKDVFK